MKRYFIPIMPFLLGVVLIAAFYFGILTWAQALGPMESPVEHGGTRTQYAHLMDEFYRDEYASLFGPLPDFSDPERFPASAGPVDDPAARFDTAISTFPAAFILDPATIAERPRPLP